MREKNAEILADETAPPKAGKIISQRLLREIHSLPNKHQAVLAKRNSVACRPHWTKKNYRVEGNKGRGDNRRTLSCGGKYL